jgi:hypothetical protein
MAIFNSYVKLPEGTHPGKKSRSGISNVSRDLAMMLDVCNPMIGHNSDKKLEGKPDRKIPTGL